MAAGARSHSPRHGDAKPGRCPSWTGRPPAPSSARGRRTARSGAGEAAGEVVAHVGDERRPRRRGEAARRRSRRRTPWPAATVSRRRDVVQGRLADPADPRLDRVQRRQQVRRRERAAWPPDAAWPSVRESRVPPTQPGLGRPEHRVDRRPFGRRRERPDDVEIHRAECRRPRVARSARRCAGRRGSPGAGSLRVGSPGADSTTAVEPAGRFRVKTRPRARNSATAPIEAGVPRAGRRRRRRSRPRPGRAAAGSVATWATWSTVTTSSRRRAPCRRARSVSRRAALVVFDPAREAAGETKQQHGADERRAE